MKSDRGYNQISLDLEGSMKLNSNSFFVFVKSNKALEVPLLPEFNKVRKQSKRDNYG